jgi:ssRNA-specific RNase YbeY (16S rRNA maturation enzyme)
VILNRQRTVPVSLASLERFWQQVRETLGLPEDSMTICLVSEAEIARWNRAYRAKSGPTDVLSFPAEEDAAAAHFVASPSAAASGGRLEAGDTKSGNGLRGRVKGKAVRGAGRKRVPAAGERELTGYLGDIAIAPAVARRNARRLGRSLGWELRILMLHGALHLLGYDHERDHGEMERLERRVRRRLGLGEK